MNKKLSILGLAVVLGGVVLGGCSQAAQQKYDAAGDAAAKAADKTGEAVATDAARTGEAVEQGVENAGEAVEDAAADTARAVDNAGMTATIKNAILTAKGLEAEDLNVDTVDKRVILKGSVPSQENKRRAEEIARSQAGKEYTVDNQLTVRPSS